jgi:hypothetical protein
MAPSSVNGRDRSVTYRNVRVASVMFRYGLLPMDFVGM